MNSTKIKKNENQARSAAAFYLRHCEEDEWIPFAGRTSNFVNFSLFAPEARQVGVAGTFNNWNPASHQLKKDPEGIWRGSFLIAPGVHQYRFLKDGCWVNDAQAQGQTPNPFGTMNVILNVA